mgnify:CR=1 FL=1
MMQGQIYVSDKTPYGFVVKGLNGALDGKFDWLVIARRKGYEGTDGTSLKVSEFNSSTGFQSSTGFNSLTGSASASPELIPESSPSPTPSAPAPSPSPSVSEFQSLTPESSPTPAPDAALQATPDESLNVSEFNSLTPESTPTTSESPIPTP